MQAAGNGKWGVQPTQTYGRRDHFERKISQSDQDRVLHLAHHHLNRVARIPQDKEREEEEEEEGRGKEEGEEGRQRRTQCHSELDDTRGHGDNEDSGVSGPTKPTTTCFQDSRCTTAQCRFRATSYW